MTIVVVRITSRLLQMTIVVVHITSRLLQTPAGLESAESPKSVLPHGPRSRKPSRGQSHPPLDDACGQETSAMVRISVLNDTLSTSIIVRTRVMTRRDVARVATAPNRVLALWCFRVCD